MKKTFFPIILIVAILVSSCVSVFATKQVLEGNKEGNKTPDIFISELKEEYIIGCWNETPLYFAGHGDNHNFYPDGSYGTVKFSVLKPTDSTCFR